MKKQHCYEAAITWTGSESNATFYYLAYSRMHSVEIHGKEPF